MIWDNEARERRRAEATIRHLWQVYGITYWPIVVIVYGMACVPSRQYREVLSDWATYDRKRGDWPDMDAELWHSEICRHLLQAGADVTEGVEHWFEKRAGEVRQF